MKQLFNWIIMLLTIVLVLQSGIFGILVIQYSESMLFRVFIGFAGIGMVIVPVVMRHVVNFHSQKSFYTAIVNLVGLLVVVITPWITILQTKYAFRTEIFTSIVTPGAVMALSASILAFILTGCAAVKRDWEETILGLNFFKIILLSLCLFAFVNLYFPTFVMFMAAIGDIFKQDTANLSELIDSYPFWSVISQRISSIFQWQISFVLSCYFQTKFYVAWLYRNEKF